MTTPPDESFADALFGSDGTADAAPVAFRPEAFADPLAAVSADSGAAATLVAPLPVVQLTPPDPREWMSHLAEEASAPQYPPPVVPPPFAAPQTWAPPAPRPSGSQRNAARQSSAPRRPPVARTRPAPAPAPAIQQRQMPASRPAQRGAAAKKKSGGGWAGLIVIIIFLVFSGFGQKILDAVMELLNR